MISIRNKSVSNCRIFPFETRFLHTFLWLSLNLHPNTIRSGIPFAAAPSLQPRRAPKWHSNLERHFHINKQPAHKQSGIKEGTGKKASRRKDAFCVGAQSTEKSLSPLCLSMHSTILYSLFSILLCSVLLFYCFVTHCSPKSVANNDAYGSNGCIVREVKQREREYKPWPGQWADI